MSQSNFNDMVVSWMGTIPTGWELRRLKTLISEPITDGPHETPEFLSEGIPFLSVDGIQEGELVFDGCRFISQAAHNEYQKKCLPRLDDLLLGKAASTGKIARVKVDFEFSIWSPLALIRPKQSEIISDFLEYSLKDFTTQAQIDCLCTANTQKNISMQEIPLLILSVPSKHDQRRISTYLDDQTAKIDRLIEMRRRQMELLKEQRAALILQAVTRGLNSDVPMKDSGISWLGEIPSHWSMTTLGRLATLLQTGPFGSQLHSHEYIEDGIPIINPSHMGEGLILHDPKCTVDEETASRLSRHFLQLGDIVFARRGEIGRCAQVHKDEVGWLCGTGSMLMRPDSRVLEPAFLVTLFQLKNLKESLTLQSVGSTMDNLNTGILAGIKLPLPPREEQSDILRFIQSKSSKTDDLISAYSRQQSLLTEYRAALIHECVTGQREVKLT